MNIKVGIVGSIKDKDHLSALKEYQKRLSRYCKIKLIDYKSIEAFKQEDKKLYIIQVTTEDQTIASETLSKRLNELAVTGHSDIMFMYTDDQIDHHEKISISKMTLSEGLFSVVMHEQIYRAYRIMRNEPYHK